MSSGGPEAHWRAQLAAGKVLLQRARASGQIFFPPRMAEPGTGDTDLEWNAAGAPARLFPGPADTQSPPPPPSKVVLVDLDEGARLMSRVDRIDPAEIRIGMRVEARIVEEAGAPLLVFIPTGLSS